MWEGPEDELTLTHNAQPAISPTPPPCCAVVGERARARSAAGAGHSLGRVQRLRGGRRADADRARAAGAPPGRADARGGPGAARRDGGGARPRHRRGRGGLPRGLRADGGSRCAANLNAPDQTVISGDPAAVDAGRRGAARRAGAKRVLPLKVSGAFHSPLMAPAVAGLARGARPRRRSRDAALPGGRQRDRASRCATAREAQAAAGRAAHRAGALGRVHADAARAGTRARVHRDRARAAC